MICKDRDIGGGVCTYIKDHLKVNPINLDITSIDGIEDLWISVQCRKLPSIIIGCIYRHPNSTNATFDYLKQIFKMISLRNKPFFALGDLNDDQLITDTKLHNIVKTLNLTQLIKKPTRITNYSSTLLDVIITNKPKIVLDAEVCPTEIGDHELISTTINITKQRREPVIKTYRSLRNYTAENICNNILDKVNELNEILNTDDVNIQLEIFNKVFIDCIDATAPMVTRTIVRPPAPWLTEEIHSKMNERDQLQKKLKHDPNNLTLRNQYKQKKKYTKNLISNAESNYYKEKLRNADNKETWKIINEIVPRKINSTLNDNNVNNKINTFNDFFAKVGEETFIQTQSSLKENTRIYEDPQYRNQPNLEIPTFKPQPTTVEFIMQTIKELKDSNAYGSDGIPTRFIKDSVYVIAFYLTIIINTSIVTGIYPSIWKHSLINPKHKKGDTDNPSNFRPLSILPVLSKILEKVVATQLMEHLENNQLISNTQHGFRKHLSTETALLQLTNAIYKNIDNKKISLLMLFDLSKAYDSISHEKLINKLSEVSVDSFWFEDYLRRRVQSVRMGNIISDSKGVNYGIPQGSILGPILFLIYINDLYKFIEDGLLIQYADDTQILLDSKLENLPALIKKGRTTLHYN